MEIVKTVYFIFDKRESGEHKFIGISTSEFALSHSLSVKQNITFDYPIWGMCCNEETYNWIEKNQINNVLIVNKNNIEKLKEFVFFKQIDMFNHFIGE